MHEETKQELLQYSEFLNSTVRHLETTARNLCSQDQNLRNTGFVDLGTIIENLNWNVGETLKRCEECDSCEEEIEEDCCECHARRCFYK